MKKFYPLIILLIALLVPAVVSAQWTQNTALVGGRTVEIIKFNSSLYALAGDGLFKSADNAANWTRTTLPFMGGGASLVVHKTYLLVVTPGIVYRTNDGNIWTTFYTAPNDLPTSTASDDQTVYVTNFKGLYYSTDDGATWTKRTESELQVEITSVLVRGQVIFASVGFEHPGTLLRSDDGGAHWQSIVVSTKQINRIFDKNGTFYVSVNFEGLYRSANGATWQLVSAQSNDSRFAVTSTNIYAINNTVFQMSTNNGSSWSSHSVLPGNRFAFQLYAADDYLYAATWDGIFRTPVDNPTAWVGVNKGLNAQIVNDIAVTESKILLGTETAYIFESIDQGETWTQPPNNNDLTTRVLYNSGTSIYKTDNTRIERSDDGGTTWLNCAEIPNYPSVNGITTRSNTLFAGTGEGVFVSSDKGLSWTKASTGINSPLRNIYTFQNDVYAGTYNGLFKLNLDGETWSKVHTGAFSENITSINGFGSILFIGTLSGIYTSTDKGAHWATVSVEGGTITLAVRNSEIYASYHWGNLYHSLDSGKTWTNVKGDLPESYVRALNFTSNQMLVSVQGHGIYARAISTLSPPFISTPQGYDTLILTTSPIVITTDQPLYTQSGDALQSDNLLSVFTIYDEQQQPVPFTASISADGLTITLTISSPTDGSRYHVFIDDLQNEEGLTVPASSFAVRMTMDEAPSVQSFGIQMDQKTTYPYTLQQFSEHFSDPETHAIAGIKIVSLPLHGVLYKNTTPVAVNAEIASGQLSTLRYTPDVSFVGLDSWSFIAFDGTRYSRTSATVSMDVVQVTAVENEIADRVSVFPTVVSDHLTVGVASSSPGIFDVAVVDITGRQLDVRIEHFSEGAIIHMDELRSGMYVVKIRTSFGWVQRRIVRK